MTALLPEPTLLADLPPMPTTAAPVLVPGLLTGIGVTTRPVPRWITDPNLIDDILAGHTDIPDDFNPLEGP
ncbi:hypothetical protein ACIRF8_15070 [Streptomyces sp. NPDC102406]|uniref:hypothetical protein n=1 Tax=Streptomyces sp. NPDC102406 TaxID=3366171 RepID=UPI00382F8853